MSLENVRTTYGLMSGVELDGKYAGITVFKGIPYAAPPIGRLRWYPPQRPEAWDGVRICDKYGPACIQLLVEEGVGPSMCTARDYHYMGAPEMSEDCLYLNICTGAATAGEKRPVYIWYHGGGLINGYAYEIEFDPSELAKKGIVVVQVGQRLNLFGYLALPQLTVEQGKSGNYGLMDQLMALDWIWENIAAFGGDPENITVGGESGGCLKSSVIAAIPASQGRIKRVINQSGSMWLRKLPTLAEEEKVGIEYLRSAGIDPNATVEELRSIDSSILFTGQVPRNITPNNMICDGDLIPFQLRDCFDKFLSGVNFINGSNFGEAEVFGKPWWVYKRKLENAVEFYAHFRDLLGGLYDKYDFESMVKVTDKNAWRTARRLAALGLSPAAASNSSRNLMQNRIFGMYMKKQYPESLVFSYIWSHILPAFPEDAGTIFDPETMLAFHSSELWFTFASLRDGVPPCRPWRDSDYLLADKVCTYWANFIRCGDPNGSGLAAWPASGDDYGYLDIDDEIISGKGADQGLDALLREFVCAEYDISI